MSRCPAGSYDAHDFHFCIATVRVDDGQNHEPANDADGVKSVFAVFEPVEINLHMRVVPIARGGFERDPVLGLVDPIFILVPFELHCYIL
jgi:hypothetical protein